MFLSHRSHDAVISIYQDNANQQIMIHDVNHPAEDILGFPKTDLVGQPIGFVLPERIHALLREYVEFEQDGNDVGSVLSKVQSFCLVNQKREEIAFRLKVARGTPVDRHDQFSLILQTAQSGRRNEAFRDLLRENFKGHEVLDLDTQLPDRASLNKDVEFVLFYVHKKELNASVAVLELDDYKQLTQAHDKKTVAAMFRHMAQIAKQNLRADDTIGFLAPKRLGAILFDTNNESARMVLNRLRWLIAANPYVLENKQTVPLSVSVGYACLSPTDDHKEALQDVEHYMDASPERNSVKELPSDYGVETL